MTQWFMGIKPGVGPVVKVMKDDNDDPLTTPSTDWQKYIFDSERAHKLGYVYDIREISYSLTKWPRPAADNSTAIYYEPSGTNNSTALEKIWTIRNNGSFDDGSQWHVIFPEKLGFSYTPIIEGRAQTVADSRFFGAVNSYSPSDSGGGGETGFVQGRMSFTAQFRDYAEVLHWSVEVLNRRTYSLYGYSLDGQYVNNREISQNGVYRDLFSVLELPAGNQAMPAYSGTPVEGQKVLEISPTTVRMAYPGHDVAESAHEAFIFNESRIPAKLIGAGEVQVNSGANVKVLTKRPTTLGTYMDYMVRRTGDAMHHPAYLPSGTAKTLKIQMQYVIEADGVRIYNTGNPDIVVRYMILADDDSAPTTGGSKVFHKGNDGSVDFIQLKLPVSSDSAPGLNEIILDTRLPYVPIVDEGWLATAAFTETTDNLILGTAKKTINFTNDGFLPFVKYMATWSDGSIMAPVNRILRSFNLDQAPKWDNSVAGATTNCRVSSNKLEFYHASGQPWRTEVKSNAFGTYADPVYGPSLVGIRWYLFAIPLSL
jgi:hypothetical protein